LNISLGEAINIMEKNDSISPTVLVVIVNYNQEKNISPLLQSLLKTSYTNCQIILIDNASNDNSRKIIDSFNDPRFHKIYLSTNKGLCYARNIGANFIKTEYIAFLDPDVVVDPIWLTSLLKSFNESQKIGVVESRIISKIDWGASAKEHVKLYALGAAFIIKRDVWTRLGGFDRDFFVGYDDQDLGWRTWILGYQVIGSSDSIVYHYPGYLRKGNINFLFRYHDFKNRLVSLAKNLEMASLLQQTPRINLLTINFLIDDFKNSRSDGFRIIHWFLLNLPKTIEKRKIVQRTRKLKDKEITVLWNPDIRGSIRRQGKSLW
jgi:GT2 family glycosyltransferase